MAQKEFNIERTITESFVGAAAIVGTVAEKTDKHTKIIFTYVKGRMVERAMQAVQRRVAKASFNYRRLRYSVK